MKVLYAIQATGNGHISRAKEIIPFLQKFAQTDIFLSGSNSQVQLPFEVKFRSNGLSLFYSKNGGLDYAKTFSSIKTRQIWDEVRHLPVEQYDLVINDFECISAYAAKLKGVKSVAFGHQAAFLSAATPRPPQRSLFGEWLLRYYAPCQYALGLHFQTFDHFIFPPIIRQEVRQLNPQNRKHYTIYLPHYQDETLLEHIGKLQDVEFHLFSKQVRYPKRIRNVQFLPIQNETYLQSLETCEGLITGGGFEAPAEAMFLGKKVLVIPIKGQYEQLCNAYALEQIGVRRISHIGKSFAKKLDYWIDEPVGFQLKYPHHTEQLVGQVLQQRNLQQCKGFSTSQQTLLTKFLGFPFPKFTSPSGNY